jgi:SAM-dependent methyltransferase
MNGSNDRGPGPLLDRNEVVFRRRSVVQGYASARRLQPPEAAVLAMLRGELPGARMLDIGVGGGRTTVHFAPLVAAYTGIDYSPDMVEACRRRFASPGLSFLHCDARALEPFPAGAFDFVLFSYNGIDYVPVAERRRVLEEVRRVLKPRGCFCFSTHNMGAAEAMLHGREPGLIARWRSRRFRRLNPGLASLSGQETAILNDGAYGGSALTCYTRPSVQIRELSGCGFAVERVFAHADGADVDRAAIDERRDPWLYYLCRAS